MAVKAPATTCRRDGSQSAEAQRSMPHETARTVPPGARVGGAPNRTLHGEAWARTAAMAQLLGRRWVGKHSAQHSSQARNTLSSTAFRERMHAATARNRFAGGLVTTSECTLFGMGLHYGSHATTARAGTRTAARGRLGMYLARRRRHEGAHAPPRLALDSRLARCGTRVNVRTTPAYTRHRSTYCRLAAVLELTLVHGHARHTAGSEATQFWRASGLTPAPCERRAIVRTGHVAGGALQFQTAVGSGRVT